MCVLCEKIAEAAISSAILVILSVISYFDIKIRKIPNLCIIGLMICGTAAALLWRGHGFLNLAAGFLAISVPMSLCLFLYQDAFGGGDIKLMAAAGFLLGIPEVYLAFALGILSAGGFALVLFVRGKRKTKIPLGPFLAFGILAAALKNIIF